MSRLHGSESGVVLILVLVMIVISTATVYSFTTGATYEALGAKHRTQRLRAELLARSGIDLAVRALQDDLSESAGDPIAGSLESPRDAWALLTQQVIQDADAGELRISIEDSGARINLNGMLDAEGEPRELAQAFLRAALESIVARMPGRAEDKFLYEPEDLANAILDWIDANETSQAFGDDEARAYDRAEHQPLNRPLFDLSELSQVPGVDALLLEALQSYFTARPMFPAEDGIGVNPNTAPPHILALIFHGPAGDPDDLRLVDSDDVFRLLEARGQGGVFCPTTETGAGCLTVEAELGLPGELIFPPLSYQSDVFSIRSAGYYGEARACIEAVIDRADEEPRTLYYALECR